MPTEVTEEIVDNLATPHPVTKQEPDTVTMSKSEVESLRREAREARESERYWAGMAKGGRQDQETRQEPPDDVRAEQFTGDPEDEVEEDIEALVNDFSTKGTKALKARGFITAADAKKLAAEVAIEVSREIVGKERQKYTNDADLMRTYPDLADSKSPLFQATKGAYEDLIRMNPSAKDQPETLVAAARIAKAELGAQPQRRREVDDDYDRYEPRGGRDEGEHDRRRRVASQDTSQQRRGTVDNEDDMLGPEARSVISQMGVSAEDFAAERKKLNVGRRRR